MSKSRIDEVRAALEEKGWKLLSEKYVNLDGELIFECPNGHKVYSNWKRMRDHFECPTCNKNIIQDNTKIIPKGKDVKRIFALDQSTNLTGWSVWDNGKLVKYGVFSTHAGDEEIARCHEVKEWLVSMIKVWRPDKVGIEGIQFQQTADGHRTMGVTVFETLAHLQGILMDVCYESNVKFEVVSTNTWREYCRVTGRTRTDKKRSMQNLIKIWYDLNVSDDEADAIGIGKYFAENYMKNITIEQWE